MIEFFYTSAWGAFLVMLMLQIPFLIVFFHIVNKKAFVDAEPEKTPSDKYSRTRYVWIAVVLVAFFVINGFSI